jgi:tetracycline resistance efflux pump
MTDSLGAKEFVAMSMKSVAGDFISLLPAVIFLVACFLAFATGTSWGTFGILIPIVVAVFEGSNYELMIISISACMAGAVCGDHCSPISDTTIMASAGAHCEHVNHVATQLPYVLLVAAVCMVGYFLIGVFRAVGLASIAWLALPICIIILLAILLIIRAKGTKEAA